jgi:hypothetical protein
LRAAASSGCRSTRPNAIRTRSPAPPSASAGFLERIQTRGYNVHFNMLRKIKPEEIPKRPKRKFKVVF